MSNEVVMEEEDFDLPEETIALPKKKKGKAYIGMKVVSIILLLAMIAGLFVPMYFTLGEGFAFTIENGALLGMESIAKAYDQGQSLFFLMIDIITANMSLEALFASIYACKWFLLTILSVVLVLAFTVVVVLVRKATPVWFRLSGFVYLAIIAMLAFRESRYFDGVYKFDIIMAAAAIGVIANLVSMLAAGKKGVVPFFDFLLLVGALVVSILFSFGNVESAMYAYVDEKFFTPIVDATVAVINGGEFTFSFAEMEIPAILAFASVAFLIVNVLFTYIQAGIVKNNVFDIIRYILLLGVSAAALVMTILAAEFSFELYLYYIVYVALILVATVLSLVARILSGKKAKKADAVEEAEEVSEEEIEEIAEEEVEEIEEIAPVAPAAPAPVYAAPVYEAPVQEVEEVPVYEAPVAVSEEEALEEELSAPVSAYKSERVETSYRPSYNHKYYGVPEEDDFLSTLSAQNKREFKKVFLGNDAPAYLPEYVLGGDNTMFFDTFFLYLGKARCIVSDSLINAIYSYVVSAK